MNTKTKDLFERARNLPLESVVDMLGGALVSGKPGQSRLYRIGDRKIVVAATGYGWFEVAGAGGKGAIDLVTLCRGGDSRSAINFLLQADAPLPLPSHFSFPISGFGGTAAPAVAGGAGTLKANPPFKPTVVLSVIPEPHYKNWAGVREWLTKTRGLDAGIIDAMHADGSIYADEHRNAIFIGKAYGNRSCEVRGTGTTKFAGRRGGNGLFLLPEVNGALLAPLAVVESAIDAISLRQLGHKGKIISSAGALGDTVIAAVELLDMPTLAAFDVDAAGDGYARKLIATAPRAIRMRPGLDLKDWNDVLLAEQANAAEVDIPFTASEQAAAGVVIYPGKIHFDHE